MLSKILRGSVLLYNSIIVFGLLTILVARNTLPVDSVFKLLLVIPIGLYFTLSFIDNVFDIARHFTHPFLRFVNHSISLYSLVILCLFFIALSTNIANTGELIFTLILLPLPLYMLFSSWEKSRLTLKKYKRVLRALSMAINKKQRSTESSTAGANPALNVSETDSKTKSAKVTTTTDSFAQKIKSARTTTAKNSPPSSEYEVVEESLAESRNEEGMEQLDLLSPTELGYQPSNLAGDSYIIHNHQNLDKITNSHSRLDQELAGSDSDFNSGSSSEFNSSSESDYISRSELNSSSTLNSSSVLNSNFSSKLKSDSLTPKIVIDPSSSSSSNQTQSSALSTGLRGMLDIDRRNFLKLIAGSSLGFTVLSLIMPSKAQAAFFGSVPGPGIISIKDTAGNKIDPKEKSPTDGYSISEIDDNAVPSYYGFVDKDGKWYISKEGTSGSYRYIKGATDFATNWTNRAALTYGYFDSVF